MRTLGPAGRQRRRASRYPRFHAAQPGPKVGVPEEIVFKTKPEIALDQLRWACEAGLPFERASCNSRLSSSSVPLCEKTLASLRRRAARLALRCARVAGASAVDVERPRGALDDLLRDHDLFYAFEARQVEHGVEQDTLTAARDHRAKVRSTSGFPLERLALRPVLRPVQLPQLALETEMITPVIDEPTTRPTNAPTSLIVRWKVANAD